MNDSDLFIHFGSILFKSVLADFQHFVNFGYCAHIYSYYIAGFHIIRSALHFAVYLYFTGITRLVGNRAAFDNSGNL